MTRRWIVDAMNVIGSRPDGWWNDRRGAMRRFAQELERYAHETEEEVTVVFDTDPRDLPELDHVSVVVASHGGRNAADYQIVRIVADAVDAGALTVVTSDKRLVERVEQLGARVTSSGSFRARLDRAAG